MLYTLGHSPRQTDLASLLALLGPQDDVVLYQDGVLAAIKDNSLLTKIYETSAALWVMGADVSARGLNGLIDDKIGVIDYMGLVKLTEKHPQQICWW